MKFNTITLLLIADLLLLCSVSEAQIAVDNNITPLSLIQQTLIGGNCFEVSNVTYTGKNAARGTFSNGMNSIGISSGVILSTGSIQQNTPGPNNVTDMSAGTTAWGFDSDLEIIGNGFLYDAASLEFDFTPTVGSLSFQY